MKSKNKRKYLKIKKIKKSKILKKTKPTFNIFQIFKILILIYIFILIHKRFTNNKVYFNNSNAYFNNSNAYFNNNSNAYFNNSNTFFNNNSNAYFNNSNAFFNNNSNAFFNNSNAYFNNSNDNYFFCFCVIGKQENLYVKELISYYSSIGVDKFIIVDDNSPNTEKISDVIQDYMKNNKVDVDIIDIMGEPHSHSGYFGIMYEKYQNKCQWLSFFDFDEYLRMFNDDGKIIGLKEYLSNERFNKCEAILINWLMYDDNDLVYYDNRTTLERFTRPKYNSLANRYVKTIARGNLNKTLFTAFKSNHAPNKEKIQCDSMGNIKENIQDSINPPLHKNAYLMHFNTRTAEEYAIRTKRGHIGFSHLDPFERLKVFFNTNKFTEEKLSLFEKSFGISFDNIRKIYKK